MCLDVIPIVCYTQYITNIKVNAQMNKVTINGEIFFANKGDRLSDVLIKSGKAVAHPCGGMGRCKKCIVRVNGKDELSCRYIIESDIYVEIDESNEANNEAVVSIPEGEDLCFVLDIGTTTLEMAVVDTKNARIIKSLTRQNPQRMFGADIISRINYCSKNGVDKLKHVLISTINEMTSLLSAQKLKTIYASGNTVMLHILFGVDCSPLGTAPYTPVFLEAKKEKAEDLSLTGAETVESLPCISSFVGADLVAGLNFADFPSANRYNLLIDLGTNAEIILFSADNILCTSAAAGPCFEGANISCGMAAANGAVYSYSATEIKTIGNEPAKGICGTGLIDIIAVLLKNKKINKTGLLAEETEIADGIFIVQEDIREYQLAKSAVYSAVMTIIKRIGISLDDIEKVYISGGFSTKINIDNAVLTGLLPKELKSKCEAINNSSLLGTVRYASEKNDLSKLTEKAVYLDLAADELFGELFIENMTF